MLDSCLSEPDHHFMVSIPENVPEGKRLPLILVIDPHGDGKLAVDKFTDALTDIPVVVAGSEKIMNNYPQFETSLSHLAEDVKSRYPVDPQRIISAGFSGGARMAYYYGKSHSSSGIIMFGAGPNRREVGFSGERVYAVSGTRDFNFMEQYRPPLQGMAYDQEPIIPEISDYICDFFSGSHEWPPANKIYEAVAWVLKDDPGFPSSVLERIYEIELSAYDSLMEAGQFFFAGLALQKAWIFSQGKNRNRVSQTIDEFIQMPEWNSELAALEKYLGNEFKLKQAYMGKLTDPDTTWWKNELQVLEKNIQSCNDPLEEDFLYRIKGFIGIILYSQINAHIRTGDNEDVLRRLMVIYALAEPDSPDLIKFRKQLKLTD